MRDYIASSQAGKYCPLLKVLGITLPRALLCFSDEIEIGATEVEIQKIMTSFDTILPDTQALEALELLREADEQWDIWILSDGDYNDASQLLKRNELSGYIKDNILCCDDLRISKPHPKVYSELMRMAVHKTQRIEVIIVDRNMYVQYYVNTLWLRPFNLELLHGRISRF